MKKVPCTKTTAAPTEFTHVANVTAIQVTNAKYRNSTINGVLQLANGKDSFQIHGTKLCAKAKLAWFGMEFKKGFRLIELNMAQVKVLQNYTGNVIAKLA
jgi:hypothetical protein